MTDNPYAATESTDALSIDFSAITGGSAPAKGAADTMLAEAAHEIAQAPSRELEVSPDDAHLPGQASGEFSCMKMLSPAQQEQAQQAAVQLMPKMLDNTQLLSDFGNQALEGVNMQVARIFKEIGPVEIPELTHMMQQINDSMRSFRKKYDPTIPQVRDAFNRFMDSVRGIFQRGRDIVEMLFEEAQTVEQQLDRIAGELTTRQREMRRNVVLCDELYKANEEAISQLIGTIAVMEGVRDQAVAALDQAVINPDDPNKRDVEEQRSRLSEFISAMEVRINEFQQRLFVAWSTSPQVRNTRSLHYGLGQRLALMVNLTIPTMKLTIAQWGLLMQAEQAAKMQQVVADGANEVLTAYAQASGRAAGEIAKTIQTPTLRPETILEVAVSLDDQAESMIKALEYGRGARQEVVDALLTAQASISQSSSKLSNAVVELTKRADDPLELPAIPDIPAAITAQAGQVMR